MKKNNKKGFTLVELVIVIAVIAILAGVMIATFSNVVSDAQASALMQEAKTKFDSAYVDCLSKGQTPKYLIVTTSEGELVKVEFVEKNPKDEGDPATGTVYYDLSIEEALEAHEGDDVTYETDKMQIELVTGKLWIIWSDDNYTLVTEAPADTIVKIANAVKTPEPSLPDENSGNNDENSGGEEGSQT